MGRINQDPNQFVSPLDGRTLLHTASDAIAHGLRTGQPMTLDLAPFTPSLQQPGACFVTLKIHGQLRGCIGSLQAHQPLIMDVAKNAFSAAFCDPRFPPVSIGEQALLQVHLSVLSAALPLKFESEADLLNQIRPGVDGLILCEGSHRGTFLPSVWEQLPDKQQFWERLKQKAGLGPTHWSETLTVSRYTTQSIH